MLCGSIINFAPCSIIKTQYNEIKKLNLAEFSMLFKLTNVIFYGFVFAVAGYFIISVKLGQFSIKNKRQMQAEIAVLQQSKVALQHENSHLENKIKRLSFSYLDTEILDEQARKILGLVRSDETVIIVKPDWLMLVNCWYGLY